MAAPVSSLLNDVLSGHKELDEDIFTKFAKALELPEGVCVECEDIPASLRCEQCRDIYCAVCFAVLHRKGNRKGHQSAPYECPIKPAAASVSAPAAAAAVGAAPRAAAANGTHDSDDSDSDMEDAPAAAVAVARAGPAPQLSAEVDASDFDRFSPEWFVERTKFIPVRLDLRERKSLRAVLAALSASDYTGRVDGTILSKPRRMHAQLQSICALLSGLAIAANRDRAYEVVVQRTYSQIRNFYGRMFEFARRHKIMNPEKMRTDYGKLVYMLQDAMDPAVQELLGCQPLDPIYSVHKFLTESNAAALLEDPLMRVATSEIMPEGKTRYQIDQEIKTKERAIEKLARTYSNQLIDREKIKWCLYSITDNHSFLRSNRQPIDDMLTLLRRFFQPTSFDPGYNLAITSGEGGARLTHDHERHFRFVEQSLTLWREITDDMFRLWWLAESDLLDPDSRYVLKDTGQGLQRVQAAPRVSVAMRKILHRIQKDTWVGSHVVHLGDNNVPNALMFIDKYTQISRILCPIVQTIAYIEKNARHARHGPYFASAFGGAAKLQKDILFDFFRNAFDGSGADNFFDAGSCIDGRLTSAWNWCSKLEQKPFLAVFRLSGFVGFDGDFQQ